jgi:hypothetical protein
VGDPSAGHAAPQNAIPVEVGSPASGGFFSGYLDGTPPTPSDLGTWFQVQLAAKPVVIALQNCPSDVRAQLELTDSTGSSTLATQSAGADGLEVDLDAGVAAAGTYLVHAVPYEAPRDPPSGVGSSTPAYFSQGYTLTITQ